MILRFNMHFYIFLKTSSRKKVRNLVECKGEVAK
jgi:hypothetical protein